MGNINNSNIKLLLNFLTNIIFIIIGLIILLKKDDNKNDIIKKNNLDLNYIFIIAVTIAIGELGDKTFLASIGLGITYPKYKVLLILGAILGMVISDFIAIILGKLLRKKISNNVLTKLSGILFILFGIFGFIKSL